MLFAHAPLSVLANEYIQRKQLKRIDYRHIPHIITISLLAGILPDFDFFILAAQSKPAFLHHTLITHTPLFWLVIAFILRQVLFLIRKYLLKNGKQFMSPEFINIVTMSFIIGTMSHLIADIPLGYIMVFYPFSRHAFTIFGDLLRLNPMISYLTHPFAILELIIVLLFGYFMLNKYFDINKKILKTLMIIASAVLFILLSYSSYIYADTYMPITKNDQYNRYNLDSDNDWQIDLLDRDINNNNKDNLMDISRKDIAKIARRVGNSHKLADINSDILLEKFGVLTPYSMISTVYYESRKSIDPVIRQHLIDKNEPVKYTLDSYFEVLNDRKQIEDYFNLRERNYSGYTLFIVDNKNHVVNAGIFVDNANLMIISPFDKRTKLHKLTEIIGIYKTDTFKYQVEK